MTLMLGCWRVFVYGPHRVASSCFLVGPERQRQSMMKPKRLASSLVYIGSLLLTLFFAMTGEGILCLACAYHLVAHLLSATAPSAAH